MAAKREAVKSLALPKPVNSNSNGKEVPKERENRVFRWLPKLLQLFERKMVGATGLEPVTSCV